MYSASFFAASSAPTPASLRLRSYLAIACADLSVAETLALASPVMLFMILSIRSSSAANAREAFADSLFCLSSSFSAAIKVLTLDAASIYAALCSLIAFLMSVNVAGVCFNFSISLSLSLASSLV